ncbi:MAG: DUF5103 domain-containing protein [Candidatus Azobacteroides sp.]|nr:DUF5103 domain-containing protein [Candidatus Azobacteroides sp.]
MRKKTFYIICWTLGALIPIVNAQPAFRTETLDNHIQTLRVSEAGQWDSAPVIDLNSDKQIEILFDALGASPGHYTYRILHCNADWTPSQLTEGEYLSGLQNHLVDDYASSFNTRMDYINYRLLLPNEDVNFKVSGNYVVQIISGETGKAVVNACFSLIEPQASIRMYVSAITDKGSNSKYQAVSFEAGYGNDIKTPVQELKVYVQQNNRFDNAAVNVKPLNVQNRKALYDHRPALIFEAGNEYRSFEMTTTRYAGLNIESVEYYSPYYHSILRPDPIRSNRAYSFYEDINGRVVIRNNETDDPNTGADYQFVHFYLPCEKPFSENVYILSEAFHNLLDARSQMEYSERDKGYLKTALLKEGYYNYMYVTQKEASAPASTASIEGNYYQTENEYRVMIYARTMGMRYDKLIGVQTIRFK